MEFTVLAAGFCEAVLLDGAGADTKLLNRSSFDTLGPFELGAGSSIKKMKMHFILFY